MTDLREMEKTRAPSASPPVLAIGLLSATGLAYEVLLTRLFSIIQWHHFAYMIISLALLGFGASGAFLTLARRRLLDHFAAAFIVNATLFSLSMVGCFLAAQQVPFNALEVLWDPQQGAYLLKLYLLLAIPFFFLANSIGLTLTRFSEQAHRIYSFDLLGAGIGAIGIVLVLYGLFPQQALLWLGGIGLAATGLAVLEMRLPTRWPGVLLLVLPSTLLIPHTDRWVTLELSPYKGLRQTLEVTGTRVVSEYSSPLGLITVVKSPRIPFRYAPGLSLSSPREPPEQLAVFTDGDSLSVISRADGDPTALAYLDYLSTALPYHLLERPHVLVLGAGGGTEVLQAETQGAMHIDAVELNPQMVKIVRELPAKFSARLYDRDTVAIHVAEARGFVTGSPHRYDLIQVALLDSFAASSAGLYALSENYLYTVEALREYLSHLRTGGLLAITRWVKLPPRDTLKLVYTAIVALETSGIPDPARRLLLIRSWKTSTLLVKKGPFTEQEIETARRFCQARSFDLADYPGMRAQVANQYNILDQAYFFEGVKALLSDEREAFIEQYKYDIRPATDDQPYFFHFFKWRTLPEVLALRGRGGLPLLEWGYLVLVATLAQAVLASAVLILLPLWWYQRRTRHPLNSTVNWVRIVSYFAAIGLGFMFIEMAFIQKFLLFLSHPLYAIAVVLAGFLVFAGLGSRYAPTLIDRAAAWRGGVSPIAWPVTAITLVTLLYLVILPLLFRWGSTLPEVVRVALSLLLIAPLAFGMGMPFPMGITRLSMSAPASIPLAWGVNGCASVISAVLATLLAIHLGFTRVILLALGLYGLAAVAYPQATKSINLGGH